VTARPYSTVPAERWRLRKTKLDAAVRRAREGYLVVFQSIKCASDAAHAGMPEGCENDGTGCLCECHDRRSSVEDDFKEFE
jgi:hypothetical protein